MNIGKLIPIVKDPKGKDDISNTRPITISDTLSNIYEKVIIKKGILIYYTLFLLNIKRSIII